MFVRSVSFTMFSLV